MDRYTPFTKGPVHPAPVRRTDISKLASPEPPTDAELERLLHPVVRSGVLSAVQLDVVALARKAHVEGGALIGGDGTGCGKGRTACGILLNSFKLDGSTRAVYVSVPATLVDVQRDVRDTKLGARVYDVRDVSSAPASGVLFVPYSSFKNKLLLIEGFLAKETAAKMPIIFDESHKATNLKTAVGGCVAQFLKKHKADMHISFFSATFATSVKDLELYADHVGLVGGGGGYDSFDKLRTATRSRGGEEAMLEFLSAELVRRGRLISRTLAFDGVEFEEHSVKLDDTWRAQHDAAALLFQDLYKLDLWKKTERRAKYYGDSLRFFKALGLASKVEETAALVRAELAAGHSVVLSLVGTGEASAKRAADTADSTDTADATDGVADVGVRDILLELLKKAAEYASEDEAEAAEAAEAAREAAAEAAKTLAVGTRVRVDGLTNRTDLNGKMAVVFDLWLKDKPEGTHRGVEFDDGVQIAVRVERLTLDNGDGDGGGDDGGGDALAALAARARALTLPPASPLDLLKAKLGGADAIAELTGRSSCMEPVQSNEGVTTWIKKPRTAKIPNERTAFQSDKKHIAIISKACSTGISLHAHKEDSRRRTHLLFELPYSSVDAMQQLGRTHRAGQSSAPKYVLLSSDFGPEKRFSATVAAKLTTLGAISTGDRAAHVSGQQLKLDGAAGLDAEQFVSVNAKHAVATLLRDDTVTAQLDDAGFKTSDQLEGRQFLNRILAARIETGTVLFNAFVEHLQDAIAIAEQKGAASEVVRKLDLDNANVCIEATYKLANGGAACKIKVDHGLTYEDAKGKLQELRDRGVDKKHAFFAETKYHGLKLIHWRTRTTYRSWGVSGQPSTGQVEHLPPRVAVDEAYKSAWDEALKKESCARYEGLLVVELPALPTLVALGRAADTKLVKLQKGGSTRLAVQVPAWYAQSIEKLAPPPPEPVVEKGGDDEGGGGDEDDDDDDEDDEQGTSSRDDDDSGGETDSACGYDTDTRVEDDDSGDGEESASACDDDDSGGEDDNKDDDGGAPVGGKRKREETEDREKAFLRDLVSTLTTAQIIALQGAR